GRHSDAAQGGKKGAPGRTGAVACHHSEPSIPRNARCDYGWFVSRRHRGGDYHHSRHATWRRSDTGHHNADGSNWIIHDGHVLSLPLGEKEASWETVLR